MNQFDEIKQPETKEAPEPLEAQFRSRMEMHVFFRFVGVTGIFFEKGNLLVSYFFFGKLRYRYKAFNCEHSTAFGTVLFFIIKTAARLARPLNSIVGERITFSQM